MSNRSLRGIIAAFHDSRRIARLAGRARDDAGMAAVEFSLILPILVLLWIGGVEVTQGLSVDRHLNNLASSIGDLAARSKTLTYADVDSIFNIGPAAMYPYCKDPSTPTCTSQSLQMRITAVAIDSSGTATVAWSRAKGVTAYAANAPMNSYVPLTLRVPDTQVIMADVAINYKPAVGYVITGTRVLNDTMYFVPRLVTKIKLCDNAGANCVPTS